MHTLRKDPITVWGKEIDKVQPYNAALSLFLSAVAFDFYTILISRFIQGLCSASLSIAIYIMLTEELENERLGEALGIVTSLGYVGLMIAPTLTSLITFYLNWRVAFLILIPIIIIQYILLLRISTEWKGEKAPIDNVGSLIYALMTILFTLGITSLNSYGIFPFIASLMLIYIFIRYEKRRDNPIFKVKLLKNVKFMIGCYAGSATYFVTSIATVVVSYHLIYILDMPVHHVGLIMLITPITMIFISIIAGRLTAKYDERKISGSALIVLLAAILIFLFIDRISIELIMLACLLQGIGQGFFSSPNNKFVLTVVDKEDLTDSSSFLAATKEFGKIVSSGIYTLLFSIFFADRLLGPDSLDHLLIHTDFIMMGLTVVVCLSTIAAIAYSLTYEYIPNRDVIELFYSITPRRIKEREWFKNRVRP